MEIRLRLDAVTGEWRAYAPDDHYRTFRHLSELRETVSKVIEDYATTLVRIGTVAPEGDENRGSRRGVPWALLPRSEPASPRDATERPAEQAVGDGSRQGVPLRGVLPRSALDPKMPPGAATPSVTNECSYCGATGHSASMCPVYRPKHGKDAYANATPGEQAAIRAALLPQDARFRMWAVPVPIGGRNRHAGVEEAKQFIRKRCHIASCSELAADPDALARFLKLEAQYLADISQKVGDDTGHRTGRQGYQS